MWPAAARVGGTGGACTCRAGAGPRMGASAGNRRTGRRTRTAAQRLLLALATAHLCTAPAEAFEELDSWTEGNLTFRLRRLPEVEERYTSVGEAVLFQALKIGPSRSDPRLIGFLRLDGKTDDEGLDFNNRHRAALGVGLEFPLGDWGAVAGGLRHEWEWRRLSGGSFEGWMAFLSWAGGFHRPLEIDWGPSSFTPALRASTWGEARAPNAHIGEERTNAMVEGAVELGLDVAEPVPDLALNLFSELEYEADTRKLDFNNSIRPAAGAKLVFEGPRGSFQIGAKAVAEFQFIADEVLTYGTLFTAGTVRW